MYGKNVTLFYIVSTELVVLDYSKQITVQGF